MTRSRQSPRKHTIERRRNRGYPRKTAISREVPSSPERLRECSPASFEVIPLAVAIFLIGAIGIIILAKNVMEFAQAYQAQDSSTMNSALKGIVAGIIMAGIATVLTFLGF